MKERIKKENLLLMLIGCAAICIVGGMFIGINSYVQASSANGPKEVTTYYEDITPQKDVASDYVKPEFTIVENELTHCDNANALSSQEAAEIGAQYLWDLFQADLNGKVIQMSYGEDPSRAIPYWHADVYDNESQIKDYRFSPQYRFSIEAVSGETSSASREMINDTGKTIPYKEEETEEYYKENCDEYLELAKEYAKKQLPSNPINAVFESLAVVIAPGYEFEDKEGNTYFTVTTESPVPDEANIIKVPYGEEIPAYIIDIVITVTDENGNKVRVEIDSVTKELIYIQTVYNGINHDPGSIG